MAPRMTNTPITNPVQGNERSDNEAFAVPATDPAVELSRGESEPTQTPQAQSVYAPDPCEISNCELEHAFGRVEHATAAKPQIPAL
jgi:hypothetical protein